MGAVIGACRSVVVRRGLASRAAVGVLLLVLVSLALPAVATADDPPGTRGSVRLSNEWTFTRWAHPVRRAPIRWLPIPGARRIAWTRYRTEDGFPEVYPALRSWRDAKSHGWVRIRIPMRPNGRTGWVRRSALGPYYRVQTLLVVSQRRLRATLYERGRRIWRAPVGIGKPSTPTPAGRFWIREKFRVHDPDGLYGTVAFGTSDYSVLSDWPGGGIIGIHGTNEPFLIPGRPSHGCIRVRNKDVRRLWRLMPIGTPLLIR